MKATFLRPFRQALRPLLVWLRRDHIFVKNGQHGDPPVGVQLKQFSWETIAVSLLLAPLAFIILLPMLIVIFPVAVLVGLGAVIASTVQSDADDAEHHTLAWHTMH
ncbi:MAG: hypothetical protein JWR15_438 [Prosthecobacter sp.]|nr:hypothetical protein [Prosthecobacter sp.]